MRSALAIGRTPGNALRSPARTSASKYSIAAFSGAPIRDSSMSMISASRSYQQNVEVLKTSKDLLMRTLRLGE